MIPAGKIAGTSPAARVSGKDPFEPVGDLSLAAGQKEQALRLAAAVHLLPDDLATQQELARIVLLLNEADRQAADAGALMALLAHPMDSRVVAALLAAQSRDANQPETALATEKQGAARQSA